jgi:hypothetical protein
VQRGDMLETAYKTIMGMTPKANFCCCSGTSPGAATETATAAAGAGDFSSPCKRSSLASIHTMTTAERW